MEKAKTRGNSKENHKVSIASVIGNSSMLQLSNNERTVIQAMEWKTQQETVKVRNKPVVQDKVLPELNGALERAAEEWLNANKNVCAVIEEKMSAGTLATLRARDYKSILPSAVQKRTGARDGYFRIDVQNQTSSGAFNIQFQVDDNSYACIVFPFGVKDQAPEKLLLSFQRHRQFVYL